MLFTYILLIWLGLSLGSFVNALVWRLKEGEDIVKGRSKCPKCNHQLAVKDLFPVFSWLILKGKCRYCKKPIHWQYPVVELATAILFVVSWKFWPETVVDGVWIEFGLWLLFLTGLVALVVYDLKYLEIPNQVIYPMIALAMLWRFADGLWLGGGTESIREMVLGILVGGGFFLALFYISKEKWIGGGDVKLGFFFGAWLGPLYSLVALLIGFYSAFLVIVPLMLAKVIGRKAQIPFGPFLVFGVFVATLWAQPIVEWYKATLL